MQPALGRARHKQRLQVLEQIAVSALQNQDAQDLEGVIGPAVVPTLAASSSTSAPAASKVSSPTEAGPESTSRSASSPERLTADVYHILRPLSEDDSSKYYRVVAREDFAIRDVVKYGLIAMGYAMTPELFHCATSLPFRHWAELVQANYAGIDITRAVSAGVQFLSQLNPPAEWPPAEWYSSPCPRLNTNTITIRGMSFAAAMLTNAAQLRIPSEALMDDEAQSRFYSAGSGTSELEEDMRRNRMRLAVDLRPTATQRRVPHHPCFDLVPWASFRSNILDAVSLEPPLVDDDDLCLDMFGGGLRCWGSTYGSVHGHGQGVPWDSRSWEAMPWFLEKWAVLTGGEEDEAQRNSAWWRAMREGEGDEMERWPHF
ncbi:uncharacterized protein E0L32_001209 [Thyridium curvatum]|uniref:Uncharacterized protein n=1 Tax=Thyridium curvatum TaxID=1093900 RepID=A0A507B2U1_9PEZI|nr:uncharacterized protein E0L32_001209 [Thyridium curvatum]TPX11391.1 hypothetical protein E0L32_001209 [Thyridium curvatum]